MVSIWCRHYAQVFHCICYVTLTIICLQVVANAVKRGLVGTNTPRDITASEPILNIHSTYGQRGSWVPPTKTSVRRYEVPRAYMPFYDLAKVKCAAIHILCSYISIWHVNNI